MKFFFKKKSISKSNNDNDNYDSLFNKNDIKSSRNDLENQDNKKIPAKNINTNNQKTIKNPENKTEDYSDDDNNSHMKKTNNEIEEEKEICYFCKKEIDEEWKKPSWKWNLDKDVKICLDCYDKKEKEFNKLQNYCFICNSKLKFIRYNPKPEWKLKGQLCRKCWDDENIKYKSQVKSKSKNN